MLKLRFCRPVLSVLRVSDRLKPTHMRDGSGAARRRTRLRAVFQVLLVGALVLVVLVGGLVVWSTGRDIYAPVWMRTQIETRLAQSMPSTTVAFGDIVMILD